MLPSYDSSITIGSSIKLNNDFLSSMLDDVAIIYLFAILVVQASELADGI